MHERIHHIMSFPGKGASSNDEQRQEVLRSSSVSFNFTMIWAWPPKNQQEWGYTLHFNISKLNTLYTLRDFWYFCCHRNPSSGKQATIPGATKAMLRLVSALHREPFQDLKFPQMARSDRSDCRHGIQRQSNGETEISIGHIRLQKRWNEINSPRLRDSRMISLPTEPYRTTMNYDYSAFWGSLVILRHLFFQQPFDNNFIMRCCSPESWKFPHSSIWGSRSQCFPPPHLFQPPWVASASQAEPLWTKVIRKIISLSCPEISWIHSKLILVNVG